MRYSREHKANTRRRILRSASQQFRKRGIASPGVAGVMWASGLTHGGFYKHFRSKEELVAKALEEGLRDFRERLVRVAERAAPADAWKEIVKEYLSLEHCEHPASGCPVAALAAEVSRAGPLVRHQFAEAFLQHREELVPFMPGRSTEEKRRALIVIFSAMSGAISVARALPEPARRRILSTMQEHLLETF